MFRYGGSSTAEDETMIILLPITAAIAGVITRELARFIAARTGHSPEEGAEAVSSAGLSLIVHEKPTHGEHVAA